MLKPPLLFEKWKRKLNFHEELKNIILCSGNNEQEKMNEKQIQLGSTSFGITH